MLTGAGVVRATDGAPFATVCILLHPVARSVSPPSAINSSGFFAQTHTHVQGRAEIHRNTIKSDCTWMWSSTEQWHANPHYKLSRHIQFLLNTYTHIKKQQKISLQQSAEGKKKESTSPKDTANHSKHRDSRSPSALDSYRPWCHTGKAKHHYIEPERTHCRRGTKLH